MAVLLAQGREWLAYRAPRPGETMLVVARLRDGVPARLLDDAGLSTGDTPLALDAPPVRAPGWREVAWRVRRVSDGTSGELLIRIGDARFRKTADLAGGLARRPSCRTASFRGRLLHPGEPRLAGRAPLGQIETRWPAAEYNLLGWRVGWLRGLLAASLAAWLLLKRPLRVEF